MFSASLCQLSIVSTIQSNSYKLYAFGLILNALLCRLVDLLTVVVRIGVKSVRSVSFGVCCCGSCLTILVFAQQQYVTVFVSGFAIFFASATTLLLT